ncbi:Chromate resistance protein ChrB [Thermogemmatispora carboxidivorans]|uniref:Chromate resistance protein ChrB n=1 Tax=Thermogemmatispora carboxidivorans TaxID=1382306 RepID=UPI00069C3017|nr:Chromate resistance protein ChrB [Thermogemmatispora carboxidivorans]
MSERSGMRWLQLTYKVPSEPSQKRVWVWRRLQHLGAYPLQHSVYVLPFTEEVEKQFRQLASEIRELGGEACLFALVALDPADEERMLQTLLEARHREYDQAIQLGERFLAHAASLADIECHSEVVQAELGDCLEKLHGLFRSARRHDLLGPLTAAKRATAAELLASCEQLFRILAEGDYPRARRLLALYGEKIANTTERGRQLADSSTVAGQL